MPSTTEALLDVNVLIASIFEDHIHHTRARTFVEALEHFYTCPTTQGGFLRFATRPWKDAEKIPRPPRLSMSAAHSKLKELIEAEGHVFLPDDLSFVDLSLRSMQGHLQWTDAYLLKLASRHRLRFASIESRMANLDDPDSPALVVVE
jgi:toxin-antitoxin system PIN domain toxin